jgi:hypothetical protein
MGSQSATLVKLTAKTPNYLVAIPHIHGKEETQRTKTNKDYALEAVWISLARKGRRIHEYSHSDPQNGDSGTREYAQVYFPTFQVVWCDFVKDTHGKAAPFSLASRSSRGLNCRSLPSVSCTESSTRRSKQHS